MRKKFLLIITCLYFLSPFQTSEYTFPVYFSSSFFFWVLRVKERGRKNVSLLCLGDGRKWRQLNGEKNFPFGPIKPTLPPFRERMSGKFCSKN
jgi:hypothetical protein